ncbi:MAG TPA: dTDP-glucose 4,6-dehydratase [Vicinamibacteria bacterium]|nr:dTDP-glucose 4,6-dehydratase [Vicinamibacteria bacterium]
MSTSILVTGGAGFIGSNFIRYVFEHHPEWKVTNLDKLTYAGNVENLREIETRPNYRFIRGDVADRGTVEPLVAESDYVVNFAAETHVDRSILDAGAFIQTDVYGTFVLLDCMRASGRTRRFIQISTDEVYGTIEKGSATESDPLAPRNPYAASKAGADRLAYSFFVTYGAPVIVTRASNNYGPRQYPEKIIPLFVTNALEDQRLPLYGDGLQVRDWLHVNDHCHAIDYLLEMGTDGETYNIGGSHELTNVELTRKVLRILDKPEHLIEHVKDRPGHDRRYSLDTSKLKALGWSSRVPFDEGLEATVRWYRDHPEWWQRIKSESADYRDFHDKHYGVRSDRTAFDR